VSVVIPIYQEAEYIEACVQSILEQDYEHIVELLCVDGGSSDGSKDIVARLQRADGRIKLLDNPDRLQAAALNIGIAKAQGDVVARIDAHGGYESDYVSQCVDCLVSTGAGNVGGTARPTSDGTYVGTLIVLAHLSRFGIGVAKFRRESSGWVDTVWPGFFWRRLFDEVGMYRLDLPRSEDNDMNERIRRQGYGIYLSSTIKASYFPRSDFLSLARKCLADGEGVAATLFSNPQAVGIRHFVPFLFMVCLLISLLAAPLWEIGQFALLAVLMPYLLCSIAFSIPIAVHDGARHAISMPAVFLLIHATYGLGTVRGLTLAVLAQFKRTW